MINFVRFSFLFYKLQVFLGHYFYYKYLSMKKFVNYENQKALCESSVA
jgi:hypothetical protein